MGPFGYRLYCGTYYLGVPRWNPNFENHSGIAQGVGLVGVEDVWMEGLGLGFRVH